MNILTEVAQRLMNISKFLDLKEKNNQAALKELLASLNEKEKKIVGEINQFFNKR